MNAISARYCRDARWVAAAVTMLLPGCANDLQTEFVTECPYTEVAAVDVDDAGEFGFNAVEVAASASVSVTAEASSNFDEITDTYTVDLTYRFSEPSDVTVIEFGPPDDPGCPEGRALRVPVRYDIAGTLGTWPVSDSVRAYALIATELDRATMATDYLRDDDALPRVGATIAPGLEDLARSIRPDQLSPTCDADFTLGPMPMGMTIGAWEDNLEQGHLRMTCDNIIARVLVWSPAIGEGE